MKIEFKVYEGDKGEKKHSRRYQATATLEPVRVVPPGDECPISDIYIKRPFANGKDKLIITISEK